MIIGQHYSKGVYVLAWDIVKYSGAIAVGIILIGFAVAIAYQTIATAVNLIKRKYRG